MLQAMMKIPAKQKLKACQRASEFESSNAIGFSWCVLCTYPPSQPANPRLVLARRRGCPGRGSGAVSAKKEMPSGQMLQSFHLVKNSSFFPLLVLKEIYHYWNYFYFFQGLKQMEEKVHSLRWSSVQTTSVRTTLTP